MKARADALRSSFFVVAPVWMFDSSDYSQEVSAEGKRTHVTEVIGCRTIPAQPPQSMFCFRLPAFMTD
jgi:hypothetical protein